jgi:multidrug efflux system membrane fusion protein
MRTLATFIVIVSMSGAVGCGPKQSRTQQRVAVTVAHAETRTMPHEIEATGTVEPQQSVEVVAQVGGTIERVAFREGDRVRRGQILFQLDARPFRAALDQARAVQARDRAQADAAKREAERAQALRDQGAISVVQYEEKQATAEALAATVRAGAASVANAQLNLQYATVRAPIDGRTGSLAFHRGDVVKPNESNAPLVTINQLDPVRVRFTVPQSSMPAVLRSRGQPLRVMVSATDRSAFDREGKLVFVDNAVDPATGTLLLKGEFSNRDESLWPGEFVRVRLVLASQPDAVIVPSVAVTNGPQGTFVYVMSADSTVAVRPVSVDRVRDDMAVIAHGVEPGEVVVTDGQLRLGPGARVVVRPGVGTSTRAAETASPGAPPAPNAAAASTPDARGGTP